MGALIFLLSIPLFFISPVLGIFMILLALLVDGSSGRDKTNRELKKLRAVHAVSKKTHKLCPMCAESIRKEAKVCRYCSAEQPPLPRERESAHSVYLGRLLGVLAVVVVSFSVWAVGYLAVWW